jgi:isopropylmalate/homocitrate/citramalate synthase
MDTNLGLVDAPEPNLIRDQFPVGEIPRLVLDSDRVPAEPAKEIWITDTTFRDGQQARTPFSVEQISHLFDLMHRLSGPKGIIRQSEFFLYSRRDWEALTACLTKGYEFPQVTGWIRAVAKDFELVRQAGLSETGILTSISDYHIFIKLMKRRREAIDSYMAIVKAAADAGLKAVRCHFEDVTRADFWGCVLPFALELRRFADESGLRVKIRLCDTMGYGLPMNDAALPRSIPKIVYYLKKETGIPEENLEWHGHNDFHRAHVNSVCAWLSGVSAVNGALCGLGERTGNSPVEALAIEYASIRGTTDGMDLPVITEIAEYLVQAGVVIPDNFPFVGRDFTATGAGIHADGLIKAPEVYCVFDTNKVLGRQPTVIVTAKAGVAGVAFWVQAELRRRGHDAKLDKRDPRVYQIHEWVTREYDNGRTTSISNQEMLDQTRLHFKEYFPDVC